MKHPVAVLVRVTEEFRRETQETAEREIAEIEELLGQIDSRREQIEVGMAERASSAGEEAGRVLDERRQEMENRLADLRMQVRYIEQMPDGELMQQATVEAEAEIEPGTSWDDLVGTCIIVEDGQVVQITREDPRSG